MDKISSENTKPPTSENSTSDRSTDQKNDFVRPGRSNAVRRNQSTKEPILFIAWGEFHGLSQDSARGKTY